MSLPLAPVKLISPAFGRGLPFFSIVIDKLPRTGITDFRGDAKKKNVWVL